MDRVGNYSTSNYFNSKAARMSHDIRFKTFHSPNPGPGTYEEQGQISKGAQVCTNFHSTIIKNIGTTEKRPDWGNRFKTPGPGAYRPPIEFGYFDHHHRLQDNMNHTQSTGFNVS